jgi:thiol-disulfide isomerase/thioredoxin
VRTLPALAFAAALAFTACSSSTPIHHVSPIPAVNATTAPLLPSTANALPDVASGEMQRLLGQLHGTPVVLNVWGSWCGPCREEGPKLAAAAGRYGRRVQFLGLDVKDTRGAAQAFVAEMGWPYPNLFDSSATAEVERALGYFAQPVTLFYGRDGKVADQISGPATAAALQAGIGRILS